MKNVHALLVGLAVALLSSIAAWIGHVDLPSLTSNPIVLVVLSSVVAVASRLLGTLLGKLGQPPA